MKTIHITKFKEPAKPVLKGKFTALIIFNDQEWMWSKQLKLKTELKEAEGISTLSVKIKVEMRTLKVNQEEFPCSLVG